MSPEAKLVINSLADITCENCIYSVRGEELIISQGQPDEHTLIRSDCFLDEWDFNVRTSVDFCSKGKWLLDDFIETGDYSYPDSRLVKIKDMLLEMWGE